MRSELSSTHCVSAQTHFAIPSSYFPNENSPIKTEASFELKRYYVCFMQKAFLLHLVELAICFRFFSFFRSVGRDGGTFDDHHHLIQSIKDILLLMPSQFSIRNAKPFFTSLLSHICERRAMSFGAFLLRAFCFARQKTVCCRPIHN